MKERLYWIDWAKAIAIYGVVLGHVSVEANPACVRYIAGVLTWFHVPLFFLVSGYLFRIKEKDFVGYLRNSAKSLLIPYVFFNIISAPILWKLQAHDVWLIGLYEFLICKSHAWAGPAWFLVALFNIRLLAYWLLKIGRGWLMAVVIILLSFIPIVLPFQLYFGLSSALVGLSFFMVGYFLKQKNLIHVYMSLKGWGLFPVPFVLFVIAKMLYPYASYIDVAKGLVCSPLSYIRSFVVVFMAISFCLLLRNWKLEAIQFISRGCIVIMGLHMTFVQILWPFRDKLPEILWFTCESPFNSISSCALSLIAYYLMKNYAPFLIGNRK